LRFTAKFECIETFGGNLQLSQDEPKPRGASFTAKFLRIVCIGGIYKFSPVPDATIFSILTAKFGCFETFGGKAFFAISSFCPNCFDHRIP